MSTRLSYITHDNFPDTIERRNMNRTPIFLYVIVAVSGASVLAVEILGTRILGPEFGVGLFLWSSLITVTLAALSAGYLAGGAMADRTPSLRRLSLLLAVSGAWIAAVPWMRPAVIGVSAGWGLKSAILFSSAALFFAPLAILGAVTPYAVRLTLTDVGRAGRTTGKLFAISTIASVASALLTGFWLIPNLGVFLLTTLLGALLLLTAAAGYLFRPVSAAAAILSLICAVAGLAAPALSRWERPDPANGLLAVSQSAYAEIRVYDNAEGRHLLIDRGIHSRIDTATGRSTLYYTDVMEIPMRYFPRPGRMLLIGLGGGSLVRSYSEAGWTVDAVEIDAGVIATAREYFNLDGAGGTIHEMDGRRFLRTAAAKYDVVLLDAYGSSSIPFHLVTAEAFRMAKGVLNEGGVLAVNVISLGWNDPLVADIAATLRGPFRDAIALPMAEPPDQVGNIILIAGDRELEAIPEPEGNLDLNPDWRYSPGYAILHGWENRFRPDAAGARVFTDDRNPVDLLSEETMFASRRDLDEYFVRQKIAW
jgi:spermidine synthase